MCDIKFASSFIFKQLRVGRASVEVQWSYQKKNQRKDQIKLNNKRASVHTVRDKKNKEKTNQKKTSARLCSPDPWGSSEETQRALYSDTFIGGGRLSRLSTALEVSICLPPIFIVL